jgi:hypothetical protein
VDPAILQTAREILRSAEAERIWEGTDTPADAPREVQPGSTDAAPGMAPKSADLPAGKYESPGGRFAKQLDEAPETPDVGFSRKPKR